MGVTQRLGTIPLAIQTDSSNNVGIGGAANASYKLAVTGASNFTGALRTESTINMTGTSAQLLQTTANSIAGDNVAVLYNSNANSYGLYIGAGSGTNHALYITDSTRSANLFKVQGNGNVGIGTGNPLFKLDVIGGIRVNEDGAGTKVIQIRSDFAGVDPAINVSTNNALLLQTNNTERMRITSGGNVLIGTTAGFNGQNLIVYRSDLAAGFQTDSGTGREAVRFWNGTTPVGTITTTASTTSYNTSSDYRLKQDLKEFKGLDLISAIKTYDYEWKSDKSRMYGVIAHELQEVLPYAVIGEKDGEQMQGVDYSKIVPVLVKAIQELNAKVTALENK